MKRPKDSAQARHPLFEADSDSRTKAFEILDSVTETVRTFLTREEPFCGEGIELQKADVVKNNSVLRYYLIGGDACEERHLSAVKKQMPGFSLRILFSTVHGSSSVMGAVPAGQMVLDYDIPRGGPSVSALVGRGLSWIVVICLGVIIYLMSMYAKHTAEDSDRFGALKRLFF